MPVFGVELVGLRRNARPADRRADRGVRVIEMAGAYLAMAGY